jgi:hypothetical protein
VQTIAPYLNDIWTEAFAWAVVLAAVAAVSALVARAGGRHRRMRPRKQPRYQIPKAGIAELQAAEITAAEPDDAAADDAQAGARLDRAREWEIVMRRAAQGVSLAPELAALQADAALKLGAAEHAYKRLAADYERLCSPPPATPASEPAPQPASAPEAPQQREPLAA